MAYISEMACVCGYRGIKKGVCNSYLKKVEDNIHSALWSFIIDYHMYTVDIIF